MTSAGGAAARRGRPVDPYVDEALRTATLEVISRAGWRGATVERIAERAGVARTTIYRRHGSVYGVMLMLLKEMYVPAPAPDTGSLRGDMIEITTDMARIWRNPGYVDFICAMTAAQQEDEQLGKACRAQFEIRRAGTVKIIDRAEARGELRPGVDGYLLLDLLSGLFPQRTLLMGASLQDEQVPGVIDALLVAFQPVAA